MKVIAITPDKKRDYLAESVIDGMKESGVQIIASSLGNGITKTYTDQEIISHSKDADLILAIWGKVRGNKPPRYDLLDKIDRYDSTYYIDGSEWTQSGYPEPGQLHRAQSLKIESARKGSDWINLEMLKKCAGYFKRECYSEDISSGIIPLLFSANSFDLLETIEEKSIDLFCCFGQKKDGLRTEVLEICKKYKSLGYNVVAEDTLSKKEYDLALRNSLITVDAWGGGDCCRRLWENLSAKSCCLMQEYNIEFPDKFTDGENILTYKTPEEFDQKLLWALSNKKKAYEIAKKSYIHTIDYHTSKKRWKYILEKAGKNNESN